MTATKIDTVVIGSGISGLTAASLLARDDREVVVVEARRRPGGALRRFTREGIPFDIGFHYTGGLGKGQILRALWDYLGVSAGLTAVPLAPNGHDFLRIHGDDREVRAYYAYEQLEEELCSVFPGETRGIGNYLSTIREIGRSFPFYTPELPLTPFLRGGAFRRGQPLTEFLAACTGDPALQAVLSAPTFLYGVPPRQSGLTMHAVVAHGYYSGAWGIAGGGQAIAEALLAGLTGLGVEVRKSSPVKAIRVEGDRVAGVAGEGWEIAADKVIYSGHPGHLPDLMPAGALRPAYQNRLRELEDTISMFIVFGMIEEPQALPLLDTANLYQLAGGFNLLDSGQTAADGFGSLMVSAPGRRDLDNSGANRGVILMRPSTLAEVKGFDGGYKIRGPGYAEWKERETARLLTRAAEAFGKDYRRIRPLAAGSPLTFRDELNAPHGGIYGIQHNLQQLPAGARTKLPGLYLSGQGSLMTGVLGSSLAGLVSAGEIVGLEKIWDRVREWC